VTPAQADAVVVAIVPLVPGDVICTGTPAGVGMGKGRFLAPGDEMVCEIEKIGRGRTRSSRPSRRRYRAASPAFSAR
jgi:2,4-didehydro-3-deoxy-L-rhamnonate hydrolase